MSYKFFQNKNCEYFPCHKFNDEKNFNCLFCYCPLYMLEKECGGNYTYTISGVKDCSLCTLVHTKNIGFNHVQSKMEKIIETVRLKNLK